MSKSGGAWALTPSPSIRCGLGPGRLGGVAPPGAGPSGGARPAGAGTGASELGIMRANDGCSRGIGSQEV